MNKKLRFTQPKDFNDPFEALPNIEAVITPEKLRRYLEKFEDDAKKNFDTMLREKLAAAGLPADLASLLPYEVLKTVGLDYSSITETMLPMVLASERERFSRDIQGGTGERMGILSLSENPTSLLMWAHYAASHFGFALEFDSAHPFFNQRRNPREAFRHLMPVSYSTDRPAVTMFDPDADEVTWVERLIAQVFLTKSTEWSYEREWRMFLPLDDPAHPHEALGRYHLFPFPAEALTGVVLGARAENELRDRTQTILENDDFLHTRIWQARISPTQFEVLVTPLGTP